jgi:protein gp37
MAAGVRRRVFTCSYSDFFIHDADHWRLEACQAMEFCRALDFQILTKRPERFGVNFLPASNFWLGVSVENKKQGLPRIDILRRTPAAVRFLSIEPLLEDLGEIDLTGINWIIIGGESGPGARPMRIAWAESLIEQGRAAGCRVFVKQTGSVLARKRRMRDSKGANPAEWPASLCVQESPRGHPYSLPRQPEQLSLL